MVELQTGESQIKSIEQTRLYFDKARLVFETTPVESLDNLPVAVEETTLVKVTLDRPITPKETLDEKTFFADKIMKRTGKTLAFKVDCRTESLHSATFRISASRNGGFRQPMQLRVNGQTIAESHLITPRAKAGELLGLCRSRRTVGFNSSIQHHRRDTARNKRPHNQRRDGESVPAAVALMDLAWQHAPLARNIRIFGRVFRSYSTSTTRTNIQYYRQNET